MTEADFARKWEAEAARFEQYGALVEAARLCRAMLNDFKSMQDARADRVLGLEEAALVSGYSKAHLMRLVKQGRLPTLRPVGSRGRLSFRERDLPRKPGADHTLDAGVHELASRLFGGKEQRYAQS